jgi:hypothetical protein
VEVVQIILSYVAIIFYFVRMALTSEILEEFENTYGNAYIPMQYVAFIDETFGYLLAFLFFAAMLSLLKLLRFNRNIKLLWTTLKICFDELLGFVFIFIIFILAFVMAFYLMLGLHLRDWSTLISCFETSFSILLGKFEFGGILETNQLAGIGFFIFNITVSIILINVLMTIIIGSFQQAVEGGVDEATREHEIIEFMIQRS